MPYRAECIIDYFLDPGKQETIPSGPRVVRNTAKGPVSRGLWYGSFIGIVREMSLSKRGLRQGHRHHRL